MGATDKAYKNARRFRRQLSLPEKLLWVRLKGSGGHFRKQHPVGQYVLDFYCASAKLAIEVDGFAHETGSRPQRDDVRTDWLNSKGIDVLRISAKDVLADPDSVADAVLRLVERPLHRSSSGPPPHPRSAGTGRSE